MSPKVCKSNSFIVIDLGMRRVHHEGMIISTDRFLVPAQFVQGYSLENPTFCIVNFQREELVTGFQGFFVSPHLGERSGFIV